MAGFGEGFARGYDIGDRARRRKNEEKMEALDLERRTRENKKEKESDAFLDDLDDAAFKRPDKPLAGPPIPTDVAAKTGMDAGGPKQADTRDEADRLSAVMDLYQRSLTLGDDKAVASATKLAQIGATNVLRTAKSKHASGDADSAFKLLKKFGDQVGADISIDKEGNWVDGTMGYGVIKPEYQGAYINAMTKMVADHGGALLELSGIKTKQVEDERAGEEHEWKGNEDRRAQEKLDDDIETNKVTRSATEQNASTNALNAATNATTAAARVAYLNAAADAAKNKSAAERKLADREYADSVGAEAGIDPKDWKGIVEGVEKQFSTLGGNSAGADPKRFAEAIQLVSEHNNAIGEVLQSTEITSRLASNDENAWAPVMAGVQVPYMSGDKAWLIATGPDGKGQQKIPITKSAYQQISSNLAQRIAAAKASQAPKPGAGAPAARSPAKPASPLDDPISYPNPYSGALGN